MAFVRFASKTAETESWKSSALFASLLLCVKNLGSSKNSEEDVTTEDTETPSAARKAADEDCALRRKPPLILSTTKDGWNYFGWKVRRPLFGNRLPCRTKCGSVSSVVPAPTKIFEVQNLWDGSGYYGIILKSCQS